MAAEDEMKKPAEAEPGMMQDENMAQMQGEKAKVDDLIGQLDSALGDINQAEGAQPGETKAPGMQQDLSPLEETLGVTAERAQMLFSAAQELDSAKTKTPADLAK